MAPGVTLVFVSFMGCVCLAKCVTAFVKVNCNLTDAVGQLGQPFLLECIIETTAEGDDAHIDGLLWMKKEKTILYWADGNLPPPTAGPQPSFKLAEPHFNKMSRNVSLLITNTTFENVGRYKCCVKTIRGEPCQVINLNVKAKYSTPTIRSIPGKSTGNQETTLVCESHGGYPKGEIQWMAESDTKWIKGAEMVAKTDQRGLFNLTSKLTVQPGLKHYTCVVLNITGGKEVETTFTEEGGSMLEIKGPKALDTPTKIVAPVVVIGSLTIGLLIVVVLLLRRRARRKDRRQSTAPLMGETHKKEDYDPDEEEGKELTEREKTEIDDRDQV